MTNKKLLMFAMAGAIAPAASELAHAESTGSAITVMVSEPKTDVAPTAGNPKRLRRTDQEQAGQEMTTYAFFTDPTTGKATNGLYFSMSSELNGQVAQNRMQLSATPFKLMQDAATGAVYAQADAAAAKYVTANNGNERRNANAPKAMTINGGSAVLVQYNYQRNGSGDTVTYYQVFNSKGQSLLTGGTNGQVAAIAKNNDDCSMSQDGETGTAFKTGTGVTKIVEWAGCNGNGADDGWAFVNQITCNSETDPTSCSLQKLFDISLAQQEERSRGNCTVSAADTSYAVCTYTSGNSQPQRQGVWAAAIKLDDPNIKGANQQGALLWKQQIAGRIDQNPLAANTANPNGRRTYAQRIIQERVMVANATTGALEPTDKVLITWGDAAGNNNNKGTYFSRPVGVAQVSRTGLTWVTPPQNLAPTTGASLKDLGGTHLGAAAAVFAGGTPGMLFMAGSLNGGGGNAKVQGVSVDPATGQLKVLGLTSTAPQDMHLYPNYLGNNPGNQGRNHSQMLVVPNPYVGQNGSTSQYLLLTSSSAKTLATTATHGTIPSANTMADPAIKLTALMTITPMGGMTTNAKVAGTSDTGGAADTSAPASDDSNASDPGTTLGGCQASGGSTGFAMALLVGLAAFIRRRR